MTAILFVAEAALVASVLLAIFSFTRWLICRRVDGLIDRAAEAASSAIDRYAGKRSS